VYANTWYHVVGVFDRAGDKGYVYVDGVKEGEASMTTDPYSNDATTKIGCRSSTSDYAFNGLIDDVMLFDRTLSGDEIQTLFNFGNLSYDAAGNLTQDQRGYEYKYDYENRIVKITKGTQTKAEFAYDALGRRIKKYDSVSAETTLYYYNKDWQVTCEYDDSNNLQRYFVYGNYIDEVLLMNDGANKYYYVHDHLYSPVALINTNGTVVERYEYDAYGNVKILDANYEPRETSEYNNPYYFTGRELDFLDSGSLKIMYYRNRFYDTYTGRWLTHDPLGITPNANWSNRFGITGQYKEGFNLYDYLKSNPLIWTDPTGLAPGDPEFDINLVWSYIKPFIPDGSGTCSIVKLDAVIHDLKDSWTTGFCPPGTGVLVGILQALGLMDNLIKSQLPYTKKKDCESPCMCDFEKSYKGNADVDIPNLSVTGYWGIGLCLPGFTWEPDGCHFWACKFHFDIKFTLMFNIKSGQCCASL